MDTDQQSRLFWHLVHHADSDKWNEDSLASFSGQHLRALAMLWGAPKTGTKEVVIIRILAVRHIRCKLAGHKSDSTGVAALVEEHKKCDLKHMCREAGLWRSGNKAQLAATLLSWRDRCRADGEKVLERIRREVAGKPRQLVLFSELNG